jgi:hypothetical protein
MPPVLYVPLLELMRGCPKDMGTRDARRKRQERADILKLVAKAVSAAALIKRGARRKPGSKGSDKPPSR